MDAVTGATDALSTSVGGAIRRLRAKGIDITCTLEARLRQLQPQQPPSSASATNPNPHNDPSATGLLGGTVDHLWRVSKHRLLSTAGVLQESRDRPYERRVQCAVKAKSLLMQIESEFEAIVVTVGTLGSHYDNLLGLLEKFRVVCDDELAKDADDFAATATASATASTLSTTGPSTNSTNAGTGLSDDGGGGAWLERGGPSSSTAAFEVVPPANSPAFACRYRTTSEDVQLAALRKTLKTAASSLQEAVAQSCAPISLSTRGMMSELESRIISSVTAKKAQFDLLRHSAAKKGVTIPEDQLIDTAALGTPCPTDATTNKGQTPPSGSSGGIKNASFGSAGSRGRSPSSSITGTSPALNSYDPYVTGAGGGRSTSPTPAANAMSTYAPGRMTEADKELLDELLVAQLAYADSMQEAKGQLHFLLEQTSMATWSCYNVFFSHMAAYYMDVRGANEALAKVLIALKNHQGVAKQLTQERKVKLNNTNNNNSDSITMVTARDVDAGGVGGGVQAPSEGAGDAAAATSELPPAPAGTGNDDDFFGSPGATTPTTMPPRTASAIPTVPPPPTSTRNPTTATVSTTNAPKTSDQLWDELFS